MSGKMKFWLAGVLVTAMCLMIGCESDSDSGGGDIGDNNPDVYVALGDSITRGYGDAGTPYPDRLAAAIGKTVINSGSDGETSGGGASRVNGVLSSYSPARLLILYGANDVLHSTSRTTIINNLSSIIQAAKDNNTIPEIGTILPIPGHAGLYAGAVDELNEDIKSLASQHGIRLVDVNSRFPSGDDVWNYMQSDGVHPNDAGTQLIADAFR